MWKGVTEDYEFVGDKSFPVRWENVHDNIIYDENNNSFEYISFIIVLPWSVHWVRETQERRKKVKAYDIPCVMRSHACL